MADDAAEDVLERMTDVIMQHLIQAGARLPDAEPFIVEALVTITSRNEGPDDAESLRLRVVYEIDPLEDAEPTPEFRLRAGRGVIADPERHGLLMATIAMYPFLHRDPTFSVGAHRDGRPIFRLPDTGFTGVTPRSVARLRGALGA